VTLPAFAAERRRLLPIHISYPHGAQQQTRRTPLLLSIDGKDGQTDGRRTLDRFVNPAQHTMRAVPAIHEADSVRFKPSV